MNGRQLVAQQKGRLDAVFARAKALEQTADFETRADYARYLCVLVSGYLEKAVAESLLQHTRDNGGPTLQRFVESSLRNFTNVKSEKLKSVLCNFNPVWTAHFDKVLIDEVKDAVDSVVANRHIIAHGGSVGLTYTRMFDYYREVQKIVKEVQDTCDPL